MRKISHLSKVSVSFQLGANYATVPNDNLLLLDWI